jgi:hypothetical protein
MMRIGTDILRGLFPERSDRLSPVSESFINADLLLVHQRSAEPATNGEE